MTMKRTQSTFTYIKQNYLLGYFHYAVLKDTILNELKYMYALT